MKKHNDIRIYSLIQDSKKPLYSYDLLFKKEDEKLEWLMTNESLRSYCPIKKDNNELFENIGDFIANSPSPLNLNFKYIIKEIKPILGVGERYKNIYRPVFSYKLQRTHFVLDGMPTNEEYDDSALNDLKQEYLSYIRQFDIIFDDLLQIFKVVAPSTENLNTFGHAIRNGILLACMEIDSMMHSILLKNEYCAGETHTFTNDYVKLLGAMRLDEYMIEIKNYEDLGTFTPFKGWKVSNPTTSLEWYDAYNKIKHNRGQQFKKANLKNLLNTIAGFAIVLIAQYGHDNDLWKQKIGSLVRIKKEPRWSLADFYIPFGPTGDSVYVNYPFEK